MHTDYWHNTRLIVKLCKDKVCITVNEWSNSNMIKPHCWWLWGYFWEHPTAQLDFSYVESKNNVKIKEQVSSKQDCSSLERTLKGSWSSSARVTHTASGAVHLLSECNQNSFSYELRSTKQQWQKSSGIIIYCHSIEVRRRPQVVSLVGVT